MTHAKQPTRQVSLEQNRLVIQEESADLSMPAASALQALEALRRRGLAYVFSQSVSWGPYDKYLTKLFGHMHRDPPPGFNRISVSQLIEADRKVFSRLIELDVKPRKASDGTFPMDDALMQALESYEVSFSLMHLQSRAAPPPVAARRASALQKGAA